MIAVILIVAAVYTLPNFYGESPAVQVSPGKATVKVTEQTLKTVEDALAAAQIKPNGVFFEQGAQQNSVRVRFAPTDGELQLRSRDVLEKALNPDPADPSTSSRSTSFRILRPGCLRSTHFRCISVLTSAAVCTSCSPLT